MSETDRECLVLRDADADALRRTLTEWKVSRVFLVTGGDSYLKSGAEAFMDEVLAGRTVERFCSFSPNPKFDEMLRGLKRFCGFRAEAILAVGGGSVIDMAKLIRGFGAMGRDSSGDVDWPRFPGAAAMLPLLAVPTTAGAGSEATGFAVVYQNGIKRALDHPSLRPDVAVLKPEFTASLPAYPTACCGFDAFAQAVESYWAVRSTEATRRDSARAITLCSEHLEAAVTCPSPEHRRGMMEAAYLAGKAIAVTRTTAAHALSYILTAQYGLPHGHAVAMFLPAVYEWNGRVSDETVCDPRGTGHVRRIMDELGALLGCSSVPEAAEKIRQVRERIGLTNAWMDRDKIDFEKARDRAVREVNVERLGNNPCKLDQKALLRVAEAMRGGEDLL